jgi:hypothetical protein
MALTLIMGNPALAQYVTLTSTYGYFLQAHKDNGETHASNDRRGDEETWVLIKLDGGMFALRNSSNDKFLSAQEGNCIRANRDAIGLWEKWRIEQAGDGQFRFKSAREDFPGYLGTNPAGEDSPCGGEVHYFLTLQGHDQEFKNNPDRVLWRIQPWTTKSDGSGFSLAKVLQTIQQVVSVAIALAP